MEQEIKRSIILMALKIDVIDFFKSSDLPKLMVLLVRKIHFCWKPVKIRSGSFTFRQCT